jgi:hypothetical protein
MFRHDAGVKGANEASATGLAFFCAIQGSVTRRYDVSFIILKRAHAWTAPRTFNGRSGGSGRHFP